MTINRGVKFVEKLRVAVIGCGSIATNRHLGEYPNNPAVELVAVCDIISARAEEMAGEY